MSNGGLYNQGLPQLGVFTGSELINMDTNKTQGVNPESAMSALLQFAVNADYYRLTASHATVAGTRYYASYQLNAGEQITGLAVRVGATGGTDLWIVELHDSTGALVATLTVSGTTAGTANTFQRIAFTAPYIVPPGGSGTYYLVIQSNGTTATYGAYVNAGLPITSGSAAGTFGTGAAITPPTTYTANLGPQVVPY